eukprot:TRINITY_DN5753_c0_g1_i1.p1 TRINITY_DN5753_c0_g1~~TRINITY_DN5753_c0_g1_i1.p1  ORF type:complete len:471 (+),score=102.34 TRINITY_DN5753_c0_g1_i1:103-1515(+)
MKRTVALLQDRSDSASAKMLKQQFAHTRGWKHVAPHKAVELKVQVLRSLADLQKRKMSVGPRTYAGAITLLGRIGMLDTVEELWKQAARFRGTPQDGRSRPNPHQKPKQQRAPAWMQRPHPDAGSMYNALLAARLRDAPEAKIRGVADNVMHCMKRHRVHPDLYTFNIVCKGHARHKAMGSCLHVLHNMTQMRVVPDVVSFNTLLQAARSEDELQRALQKMQAARIRPNAHSYTASISVYTRSNDGAAAEAWFNKARAEGFATVPQCLDVMRCHARAGAGEKADALLSTFLAGNAGAVSREDLLEGYHCVMQAHGASAGGFPAVCRVYKTVAEAGLVATYRTYTHFIDAVHKALARGECSGSATEEQRHVELAEAALSTALGNGQGNNINLYEALGRVYHAVGDRRRLEILLERHKGNAKLPPSLELEALVAATLPTARPLHLRSPRQRGPNSAHAPREPAAAAAAAAAV